MMSLLRRAVEATGARVNLSWRWLGGLWIMLTRTFWIGPRPPLGLYDISHQTLALGIRSLPMASLLALFVGMIFAWQFGEALKVFGATSALGYAAALANVRELVPTLLAVTVGAKMATGMTAELASMKVTEQIDAIGSLGAEPLKKLVWPRLVASMIALPALTVWGNILALLGGMFVSEQVFNVPSEYFYETYIAELVPRHYITGLIKSVSFGLVVGIIGAYQGFATGIGTEAVGKSTTETTVACAMAVILVDFVLTTVLIPIP